MDDGERAIAIENLLTQLSEATTRRTALVSEAQEFAGRMGEIRAAFGNPYFYSDANPWRPVNAAKSAAHYSGFSSHDVVLPTMRGLIRADRELRRIKAQLLDLGTDAE